MLGAKAFRSFVSVALLLLLEHAASVAAVGTGGTRRRIESLTGHRQQHHPQSTRTVRGLSWSDNHTADDDNRIRRIKSGSMRSCKMLKKDASCAPSQSPAPSDSPSRTPSASPTSSPSASPSVSPTVSSQPSQSPSSSPSSSPTISASPSVSPTSSPSASPTRNPTNSPTRSPTKSPTLNPTKNPTNSPTSSPITPAPTDSDTKSGTFDSSQNKQCAAGSNQTLKDLKFTYEYRPCSTNLKYTCTDSSNEACDLTHQIARITCFPLYDATGNSNNASPIFVGYVPNLQDFKLDLDRDLNDKVDTVQQLKCQIHTTQLPTTQSVCQEVVFDITENANNNSFVTGNQYGSLELDDCEVSGGDDDSASPPTTSPPTTSSPVPTTQSPTILLPTVPSTISQVPSQTPTTSQEPSKTLQPSVSTAPTVSPTVSSSPSNSPSVSSPPTETPPFDTDRDAATGEIFSECKNVPATTMPNDSNTNDDLDTKIQVLFQFRATVAEKTDVDINTILENVEGRAHTLMARRFLDCVFTRGSTRGRILQMMKEYRLLEDEEDDLDVISISSTPKAQTSKSEFCPPISSDSSLQRDSEATTSCYVVNDGITFTARNGTNLSNDTIKTAFGNLLRKSMGPTGSLQRAHPDIDSLEFVGIKSIAPVDSQGGGGNIDGINQDPDPVNSGNDTNLVMPLSIAGAAVVLIVGFAMYRRNRQRHEQDDLKNRTFESLEDDQFSDEMHAPVMFDEDNSRQHVNMGARYHADGARSVTSDTYIESDQHMMDTGSVWGEYTVNSVVDSQGNAQGMEIRPRGDHPFDEFSGRGDVRGSYQDGPYQDGPSVASQQLAEEVVRSMRLNRSTSSRGRRSYDAPDTVVL
mmetsp:Transcript_24437/g.37640  ORF Transcript_24437/g.37640 Transcript_24437/m.37640 type:complete len:862 (+) Transcript_24437:201-2786(+)|eukprot:CAMPEP_0195302510 /NCGR_PEP_ID=MMETSP0707-20130614/31215_1 /TAXON_ID=33640 /ORGANISM="Asterionellopsis glacialis, Strain CCMP134" /LENGTH=861 /DNA_ID=CAMNT_0040365787 /DNA_START=153 /DNA_END=2738 /DNA_ORIENTATION=-